MTSDQLNEKAYDEALLAFKKVSDLHPGQAVALKDAVMAYANHLTAAHPVVTTVGELEKLPMNSLVLDRFGYPHHKYARLTASFMNLKTEAYISGREFYLPARVLWMPEVNANA